jgi:hypothetical protein
MLEKASQSRELSIFLPLPSSYLTATTIYHILLDKSLGQ